MAVFTFFVPLLQIGSRVRQYISGTYEPLPLKHARYKEKIVL
jgi:hypothetical protein